MGHRTGHEALGRREFLKRGALGAAGCLLLNQFPLWAATAPFPTTGATQSARAKAVIQIWMWGGPCHLDTFDPKPEAGRDYCGPLTKPIETNVSGVRISELLPLLAKQANQYSLIRGMTHGSFAHETASYITQTGFEPGDRLVHPCAGAVVCEFKGYDHGYKGALPPYIVLTEPLGRFSEAGLLGSAYKPFATGGDPNQKVFAVEGITLQGMAPELQNARHGLRKQLDTFGQMQGTNTLLADYSKKQEEALHIAAETAKYYNLESEPAVLRDRYGRNTFGQSCLLARRLVEQGVPYIAINYRGWDTHRQHFEIMRRNLPELDQGLSTLLADLNERGLLDSTIVWCGGEFGRTPKVLWEAPWNGGRGHYGRCFSTLVAGGGFKGGHVVGTTDATGEEVAQRPVHPRELLGSIYTLLGIDPEGPLPNKKGLDVALLPATAGQKRGVIHEII